MKLIISKNMRILSIPPIPLFRQKIWIIAVQKVAFDDGAVVLCTRELYYIIK